MRTLYHHILCPFSRQVRMICFEKNIECDLKQQNFWERNINFIKLNPALDLPIFIDVDDFKICSIEAIVEYLEEVHPEPNFLGYTPKDRAEIRRVAYWFNNKLYNEVTKHILNEKIIKFFNRTGAPNSAAIMAAKTNIKYHLDYIAFLLKDRKWLAGDYLSIADFAAAGQLSLLDYFADIPWEYNQTAKEWYSIMKSRPSLRNILFEKINSFSPPYYYTDPDF